MIYFIIHFFHFQEKWLHSNILELVRNNDYNTILRKVSIDQSMMFNTNYSTYNFYKHFPKTKHIPFIWLTAAKTLIIYKSRSEPYERTQYEIWAGFGPVGSTENFGMGHSGYRRYGLGYDALWGECFMFS